MMNRPLKRAVTPDVERMALTTSGVSPGELAHSFTQTRSGGSSMSPSVLFGWILLIALLIGLAFTFEDEILALVTDPETHVEAASSWGVTKAGKLRPTD